MHLRCVHHPQWPDGTRAYVRSEHFVEECEGVITTGEYDGGWLYRVEVTNGDPLNAHRNEDGELWVCDFEVQPTGVGDDNHASAN